MDADGGTIRFDDVDQSDTHTIRFDSNETDIAYRGSFHATLDTDPMRTGQGSVAWSFTIDGGHGGAATQTVSVTRTGADDGPIAVADGARTLEANAVLIDVLANDTDPDLTVTAVAQEAANGDEATASDSIAFETTYNAASVTPHCTAAKQSIWGTGLAYAGSGDYVFSPGFPVDDGALNAGLQSHGNMERWYNSGTDVLTLNTEGWANPAASTFNASIPELGFDQSLAGFDLSGLIDFIFWGFIQLHTGFASPGLDIGYGKLRVGTEIGIDLNGYLASTPISLVNLDGTTFAAVNGLISGTSASWSNDYVSAWGTAPNFSVLSSNFYGDTLNGLDARTFADLTFDLDAIAADIAGDPDDPLSPSMSIGVPGVSIGASATALKWALVTNLFWAQQQELDLLDLLGTLTMEDGTAFPFVFQKDLSVPEASQYDANGDGTIAYDLTLDKNASSSTTGNPGLHFYDCLTAICANLDGSITAGPCQDRIGAG